MRASKRQTEAIRRYVEDQAHEQVIHLEKAASERVGPVRHDIWDVHCADSRWWVITEPVNLYSQEDFKSRDVALTFHIGLSLRVSYLHDRRVPVAPEPAAALAGSWRRWEQAFAAYDAGEEAEDFQAVGVRLRECLIPAAARPPGMLGVLRRGFRFAQHRFPLAGPGSGVLEHGGDAGPQAAHQPADRDPPQPRRDVAVAAEAPRSLPDGDEGVLDASATRSRSLHRRASRIASQPAWRS
jgi:hypothetical protein